jgi:hypothetical protein
METWEIEARLQIRALVDKNAVLYDLDRFEEAYGVFTEDGVLEPVAGQKVRHGWVSTSTCATTSPAITWMN